MPANETTICDNWMWEFPLRANVASASPPLAGAAILDLGCGRGLIAEFFTSLGARVTGIDIVRAAAWSGSAVDGPVFVCGTLEELPFRDDAFDIVVSCSTLQYVDQPRVFAEILRVTRGGGMVLLHENMPHNPAIVLYRLMRRVRSVFSPSLKAYSSTITKYLAPDYPFPTGMRLEHHRCYYFLSSLCSAVSVENGGGLAAGLAGMLFRIDCWLLNRVRWLQKFCWFCSYTLTITKRDGTHRSDGEVRA